MRRTQILVSEKQYAALRRVAEESGLSASEHIRRALDRYLERRPERPSWARRRERTT